MDDADDVFADVMDEGEDLAGLAVPLYAGGALIEASELIHVTLAHTLTALSNKRTVQAQSFAIKVRTIFLCFQNVEGDCCSRCFFLCENCWG